MKKSILLLAVSALPSLGFAQWTDQTSGVSNDLNDVFFTDNSTGWAVGRQGTMLTTSNGGSTWSAQNSATTEDLNAVFMVSSSVGYAVGDKGKISKYNGTSWSAANTSETRDVFGVYFMDSNTGWAVGDWGRLYYTSNGGSSWINQNNDPLASYKYNDVHMISASQGWSVGTSGRVVKYNGTNWLAETSGVTIELLGVHFLNANFGFAVGKGSTILFYNGSTWSTHNSGLGNTTDNIYDVHIVSQNEAYAVVSPGFGGAGVILKYNGSTWSKHYEFTGIGTELFYGIHFPSASKGYAAGAGGIIKTYGSGGAGISSIDNFGDIAVSPNPFSDKTYINFSLKVGGKVSLVLSDITGKIIKTIMNDNIGKGDYRFPIDCNGLPQGLYFYTLMSADNQVTGKLIKQ